MINVAVLFIILLQSLFSLENNDKDSFLLILPDASELSGWIAANGPLFHTCGEWEELYPDMKQVFLEYGLRKIVTAEFINKDGNVIYLEIKWMNDNGGAYGLFSVSRMHEGSKAVFGDESFSINNKLHLWKGDYYIKIYSNSTEKDIKDGIFHMADIMDNKIKPPGLRPKVIEFLPEEGFVSERTRYFRGSGGMNHNTESDIDYISGFDEGAHGDFGTYQILLLKYQNTDSLTKGLEFACETMRMDSRYIYTESNNYVNYDYFEDKEGNKVVFGSFRNYMMIYTGQDLTRQPEIFERIVDAILLPVDRS